MPHISIDWESSPAPVWPGTSTVRASEAKIRKDLEQALLLCPSGSGAYIDVEKGIITNLTIDQGVVDRQHPVDGIAATEALDAVGVTKEFFGRIQNQDMWPIAYEAWLDRQASIRDADY
jgi:hypothetical protein